MSKTVSRDRFLVTQEHRRFVEFCDACRRYRYIGLCYGAPGVGKTMSARAYARWDRLEPYLQTYLETRRWPNLRPNQMRTVLYTPNVSSTPQRIRTQITDLRAILIGLISDRWRAQQPQDTATHPLKQRRLRELILVDEAGALRARLGMNSLEEIRDLYDRQDVAVIFLGLPGLEKRLARYPQLYSRVGFAHHFKSLNTEDMHLIFQHKWQQFGLKLDREGTDAEAIATIIRMTTGNFRLIQRLFNQIERIMQINQLQTITKEVVEAARELLVIGPA